MGLRSIYFPKAQALCADKYLSGVRGRQREFIFANGPVNRVNGYPDCCCVKIVILKVMCLCSSC